jgi:hypothetical protein
MGVKVTLISSRDRVLPHEDANAAAVLEGVFAEKFEPLGDGQAPWSFWSERADRGSREEAKVA